jgi:hypothetical protein
MPRIPLVGYRDNVRQPFKDPNRDFQKYIKEQELNQQTYSTINFKYIDKWANNEEIDLIYSIVFWKIQK